MLTCAVLLWGSGLAWAKRPTSRLATSFDVREFGALADGKTPDSNAINAAIDAASAAGGGTVRFPAGNYLSVSIRLKSNVRLSLEPGATIIAAHETPDEKYDAPEPNPFESYQGFGNSHWHNGLIWGDNLQDVSIVGPGCIFGDGLVRGHNSPDDPGDKAIALKQCRNVTIRDITIKHGGHFALLATGCDDITVDNVKIDTNRDGIDIDACRGVQICNCSVNAPYDDGICLKSSYALGAPRATERVTITNCQLSGYDEGTLLDGTHKRDDEKTKRVGPASRIKLGTESNGGFRNITISNCTFDYCRGLALECVDGGTLEDVAISNLTMRDIVDSPIFLRLGARLRGPAETKVGQLRRVTISNIICDNAATWLPCIITGVPGARIEDVKLCGIRLLYTGGASNQSPSTEPAENENVYPDPRMFGPLPSYAFFIRHVKGIEIENVKTSYINDDPRPPISLVDVEEASFSQIKAQKSASGPTFQVQGGKQLHVEHVNEIRRWMREVVEKEEF